VLKKWVRLEMVIAVRKHIKLLKVNKNETLIV